MIDDMAMERVQDYVVGGGVMADVVRESVPDYVVGGGVIDDVVGRWEES